MPNNEVEKISARPVKSFFVQMLTRDILLADAILDLLDNCVDGIQRNATKQQLGRNKPYGGFEARITLSDKRFIIKDNCGGIPWEIHDYAFRMGNIKRDVKKGRKSVGTYGIGMKRAIFKIGEECLVKTHAKDRSYQVHFTPDWLKDEDVWDLNWRTIEPVPELGTKIKISQIHESVGSEFRSDSFIDSFRASVSTHYAYILEKGFSVYVNDELVKPKAIRLVYSKVKDPLTKGFIRPFIYKANHDGVEIFMTIGFTSYILSEEEIDNGLDNYKERYRSEDAGWTVICNDRTVLYCDKSPLTGWGVSGVPQYHTQFIAISGIVLFSADDPKLLPTTTTKRGIDASSHLYLQVRDKMIEGMKIFTKYTYQWKTKELAEISRKSFRSAEIVDLEKVKQSVSNLKMTSTKGAIKGSQYKPLLPSPDKKKTSEKISFTRPLKQIRAVSRYLFDKPDVKPNKVGEECFNLILEETGE